MNWINGTDRANFGNVNRRTSTKGMISTVLGGVCLLLLLLFLFLSAGNGGNIASIVGALAIIIMAVAVFGIYLAVQSFHEVNRNHATSYIGIIINGLTVLAYVVIFLIGLR